MNNRMIKKSTTLSKLDRKKAWNKNDLKEISQYEKYYKIMLEIRELREESGYTQEELSIKSGIARPDISKILNGKEMSLLRL